MSNKDNCENCGIPFDDDEPHDQNVCFKNLHAQIKKLNGSVLFWKDAWFGLREIIGKLWWYHPAITDDKQREYYQNQVKTFKE